VTPPHVGVTLALGRLITEVPPSIDHLLGRASADAELQPTAGDQVVPHPASSATYRAVLVAHVDDRRAYFDAAGLRADILKAALGASGTFDRSVEVREARRYALSQGEYITDLFCVARTGEELR